MLWLSKQVFPALLSFSGSLVTKCVSLNNEPCMIRPTFIHLNPMELNYYPFMIGLDKCNGSCNAVDDLTTKIRVPGERKDINVKVVSMITRINEAKTLVKQNSFYVNENSIVQHAIQIKSGIIIIANVSAKSIARAKKIKDEILVHVFDDLMILLMIQ